MSDFVVTTAGLAAASVATPTGPYIEIVEFKLGSNATTPAAIGNTGLAGSTVYTGGIASYSYYDATTIQINLEVPASAGPFNYGEVGLYLPGNVLFARFSYGTMRTKASSSLSGYANTLRIKALVRLAQGPAVFSFAPGVTQTILEVASLQLLQTPADHPENPVIIVHEVNDYQDSTLFHKHSATLWTPADYSKIGTATITAASDSTHLTATLFGSLRASLSGNRGKYMIQVTGGYWRSISSITGNVALLGSSIATGPLIGTTVAVYEKDSVRLAELEQALIAAGVASLSVDPVGTVTTFYGTSCPTGIGKVELNGGLASRASFPELFAHAVANGGLVSEATWFAGQRTRFSVGNGTTTFRLPDFRGEFARYWDHSRGLDAGRTLGSWQDEMVGPHVHDLNLYSRTIDGVNEEDDDTVSNTVGTPAAGYVLTNSGTENRSRNVALMAIMKAGPSTLPAGPAAVVYLSLSPTTDSVAATEAVAYGPTTVTTATPAGAITHAIASGTLPTGMSLTISGSNLQLAGTPTGGTAGTYNLVVNITLTATGEVKPFALQIVVS